MRRQGRVSTIHTTDGKGNERYGDGMIEAGDWIKVPDEWYAWEPSSTFIYGSKCRLAEVMRVYSDGYLSVRMHEMRDLRFLERQETFHYDLSLNSDEAVLALTAAEYANGGVSAPVTPHHRVEGQPRDAAGRFTSSNTTERPTLMNYENADTVIASWMTSMTQTNVTV